MSTVTERSVEHDGAVTHYLDCRPGDGSGLDVPPLVFVPGMTDVADDYRPIAEHTGRRTLVIELRGHGRSTATSGWGLEHRVTDIEAVIAAEVDDGPLHVMTFSRGSCYALAWAGEQLDRIRSFTIGDYPAREIRLPREVGHRLVESTWRGTPVTERLDTSAVGEMFDASEARPLWHVVEALVERDVPVTVVRSTAPAPINDDDWERYGRIGGVRMLCYDDSPHDIFRPDRTRFPRLVAEVAADGDARARTPG